MRRVLIVAALVGVVVAVVPSVAVGQEEPTYTVDEASLPFDSLAGHEDSTRLWGIDGDAGYRIEVPSDWNGDLVMWAHGYRGTGSDLFFAPIESELPLRDHLLDHGFAWAMSTYSKNDYNVAAGVIDTKQLTHLFKKLIDQPDRIYIAGVSMGGHVTAVSIEHYPDLYAGALPVCGVVGDFELFDFFLDFNVTAQQIALGDSVFPVDPFYPVTTAPSIKASLEAFPGGWPLALNAAGEGFKQLVELRSGGDRPNFDEAWFFWNSFPEFGSGIPGNFLFDLGATDGTLPGRPGVVVDNTDAVYQLDLDPALSTEELALNEDVVRVAADPEARRGPGLRNVPKVTGRFRVPVLTLHNLGDLFVPFHNELAYRADAAASGNADLLVQRAIRGVNHCGFTRVEYETAFADLVHWVETGEVPAGDDLRSPEAVADPRLGCTFTDFATPDGHLLPAPCPAG